MVTDRSERGKYSVACQAGRHQVCRCEHYAGDGIPMTYWLAA